MSTLFVYAEHENGRVTDAALEVIGAGREAVNKVGGELAALLLGPDTHALVSVLGAHGADRVILCQDQRLGGYAPEATVHLLAALTRERAPVALLFPDTPNGGDVAVRLAARLGTGFAARCTALAVDAGTEGATRPRLRVTRPAYADRLQATVVGPQTVTLQQGAGEIRRSERSPCVEEVPLDLLAGAERLNVMEIRKADPRSVPLPQAEFILSGGNGVQDFDLLWNLADRVGAAVGGSRVVCDDGRLARERQIGESGVTVRPRCYLAFGISGASQHLRGMEDSQIIIAVNKDRHAPLMKRAQLSVVADAEAVMRAMLARIAAMDA